MARWKICCIWGQMTFKTEVLSGWTMADKGRTMGLGQLPGYLYNVWRRRNLLLLNKIHLSRITPWFVESINHDNFMRPPALWEDAAKNFFLDDVFPQTPLPTEFKISFHWNLMLKNFSGLGKTFKRFWKKSFTNLITKRKKLPKG